MASVLPVSTANSQTISSVGGATPQNITALVGSDGRAGVYWKGANGDYYTQNNLGQISNVGTTDNGGSFGGLSYRQISDPNPPQTAQTPPAASGGGSTISGGGSAGPVGPSAADTDPLLASLATLDTILGNKNAQSQQEHDAAVTGYDAADKLDHAAIDQNTHQNEQNLTADDHNALLNAANGATGLRGTLASIGALGGSGFDVIRRLVGLAANSDTGAARKTFDTNATGITQAAAETTQKEAQRRKDADATLANNFQDNQANVLTSKQSIFQKLADLYGSGTAQGNNYASQAGALAAPIAATTHATVAPYAPASSLYSPSALQTYLAGTQNLNTSTSANQSAPINSPSYIPPTKKDATLTGVA